MTYNDPTQTGRPRRAPRSGGAADAAQTNAASKAPASATGFLPEAQAQALLARIEDAMAHAIDLARRMPSDVKT